MPSGGAAGGLRWPAAAAVFGLPRRRSGDASVLGSPPPGDPRASLSGTSSVVCRPGACRGRMLGRGRMLVGLRQLAAGWLSREGRGCGLGREVCCFRVEVLGSWRRPAGTVRMRAGKRRAVHDHSLRPSVAWHVPVRGRSSSPEPRRVRPSAARNLAAAHLCWSLGRAERAACKASPYRSCSNMRRYCLRNRPSS